MKTTTKYVLQGRYTSQNGMVNAWEDEAKDDKIDRINAEYRAAVNIQKFRDRPVPREFRIVERTIVETDEIIKT